jgi:hypothetical protein
MSINQFLDKENIELLWEVLTDEPLIKQLCDTEIKIKTILHIFQTNLHEFFDREKNNCTSLIDLNKKYIVLIINYVMKINNNSNFQEIPTNNQYRKIKIHQEEPVKQSITFEEIQNDRKTLFEKELNKKQEEFTNSMSLPVPPVPNFSDKLDQPISEIELEIKRIQEQRNYDIEIINNTNKNSNSSVDENWLKPQETSIKNEKLAKLNSITGLNIILNTNNKHISWEDEKIQEGKVEYHEEYIQDNEEEINIFGKLKKINNTPSNSSDNSLDNTPNNYIPNYQLQIDDLKKEISALNEKLDIFLEKYK